MQEQNPLKSLDSRNNGLGKLLSRSSPLEIPGDGLSLCDDAQSSSLDVVGHGVEVHCYATKRERECQLEREGRDEERGGRRGKREGGRRREG